MVKYSKLREITTVFAMKCTLFFFLRSVGVYVKSRRTQHNSCTKNNNSIFVKANSFFYARSSRRCRLCLCTVSLLVAFEFDVFWLSLRPGTAKTKTNKKPFAWMLSFLFVFNWWFCVFQCVLFFSRRIRSIPLSLVLHEFVLFFCFVSQIGVFFGGVSRLRIRSEHFNDLRLWQ